MIRLLLHPMVLFLIALAVIGFWMWANRVNLRVRLRRLPTQKEWAILALAVQLLRWLLRLRI